MGHTVVRSGMLVLWVLSIASCSTGSRHYSRHTDKDGWFFFAESTLKLPFAGSNDDANTISIVYSIFVSPPRSEVSEEIIHSLRDHLVSFLDEYIADCLKYKKGKYDATMVIHLLKHYLRFPH